MSFYSEIKFELQKEGVDFIYFVNISKLSEEQNKGFSNAILFGIILSPGFISKVKNTPNYVEKMIQNNEINDDEFHLKEIKTDKLADSLEKFLKNKGYAAYAQSEKNIELNGLYNTKEKSTPLPNKTIALLAGMGWIGKHNLLITSEFGSAISMCSVLTNAPLNTVLHIPELSKCADCRICVDICPVDAIKGKDWSPGILRDEIVDVFKCTSCLKCMVHCPWTLKYLKKHENQNRQS